jgi:hypothetical protein
VSGQGAFAQGYGFAQQHAVARGNAGCIFCSAIVALLFQWLKSRKKIITITLIPALPGTTPKREIKYVKQKPLLRSAEGVLKIPLS